MTRASGKDVFLNVQTESKVQALRAQALHLDGDKSCHFVVFTRARRRPPPFILSSLALTCTLSVPLGCKQSTLSEANGVCCELCVRERERE